jgi:pimeloyl-ACP methyl ester carboxylesterase
LTGALVRPGGLDLDRAPNLQPTALIRTFTAVGGLLHIQGYEDLENHLRRTFRDPIVHTYRREVPIPGNVDVLLFPYDFRRSVRTAAEALADAVNRALAGVNESARRKRVIVIAHSMGGLVARYWLGPLGGAPLCAALFTLGTPHRGAPKALDWLVNGAGAGRLRLPWVTRVLRGWPSVYELLPQYPAVWDAATSTELEFTHLPLSMVARRPRLSRYREAFASKAADGRRTHEEIARAWAALPPDEVPVVPYFGRGHPTQNRMELAPSGRLTVSKIDPHWRGNVGWRGDGTVPVLSAIPRELGESRSSWRGVADRHSDFAGTAAVLDLLVSYTGEALPTRGGERPERPWLGLNVEDVVASGEPIPVGVVVQSGGSNAKAVHLILTDAGNPFASLYDQWLSYAGEEWRGVLPALPVGRYRLTVEAQRVYGPESVFAGVDLVVLDPDAEAEVIAGAPDADVTDTDVEE